MRRGDKGKEKTEKDFEHRIEVCRIFPKISITNH